MIKHEKSCGAVVYRRINEDIEFLLVRSKSHGNWGFPKGHVEKGESEYETAKREVLEETGLDVELYSDFRAKIEYMPREGISKEVVFFIGEALSHSVSIQQEEIQEYKWLNYNGTLGLLSFETDKEVLKQAAQHLKEKE